MIDVGVWETRIFWINELGERRRRDQVVYGGYVYIKSGAYVMLPMITGVQEIGHLRNGWIGLLSRLIEEALGKGMTINVL